MRYYHLLILLGCFILFSCPRKSTPQEVVTTTEPGKELDKSNMECETSAMVRDFTGNDGCRFLFVLDNGDKLLPNEMPLMDFKLADNQLVKIGYDVVKDGLSACMMENFIVKVNCITLEGMTGGVKPAKKPCVKVDNYNDSKWLKSMAGEMKPYIVTRYTYLTDGWAYLIDNGRQKKLIDCQGTEICSVQGKALNACTEKVKSLGKGTVIYATKPPRNE